MQHFKTEIRDLGSLASGYYHSPEDIPQSITDYLEDNLSNGFELLAFSWHSTSDIYFVFRVVAK